MVLIEKSAPDREYKVEMIGGVKIVNMAPPLTNHNIVKNNIFMIFSQYLLNNTCMPFGDNEKVVLEDDSYVIPDFLIVCDRSKIKRDGVHGAPDVVVEVISPNTAKNDRGSKRDLYQRSGVKEYWIIEPDKKEIEIYVLSSGVYQLDNLYRIPADYESEEDKEREADAFSSSLFPDLTIRVSDVFANVMRWDSE